LLSLTAYERWQGSPVYTPFLNFWIEENSMPPANKNRNLLMLVVAMVAVSATVGGQTTAPPVARFAAQTANLKGGPDSVRIDVLAWSTDAARSQLVDAWNLVPPAPAAAPRGAVDTVPGRGAGPAPSGRGTRGARGAPTAGAPRGAAAVPNTPDKALAAALDGGTGVGYLWTSESTGYSLRYAYRIALPDGGERIILATDRRLGDLDGSWKPADGLASEYDFSVIELRLNARHEGEGKASVTGKVAIDSSANTIALEGYAALPLTFRDVKARTGN
jgi:hypothetical protein